MACEQFKSIRVQESTMLLISRADEILQEYSGKITLRQLYYQFVSRNWLPNVERSYKNLGEAVSKGRLIGEIDWDAIEDRARSADVAGGSRSAQSFWDHYAKGIYNQYGRNPWETQAYYVELWVEKDALASVLSPIARRNSLTLMVNRGYSSQSAMYECAMRIREECESQEEEKNEDGKVMQYERATRLPVILYLGDHDPSGEDMVRDVQDRLEMFGCNDLTVDKVALTMDQIRQFRPPPQPAKTTDSRHARYVQEHGTHNSWELDALNPNQLNTIVQKAIDERRDNTTEYNRIIREDKAVRERMKTILEGANF